MRFGSSRHPEYATSSYRALRSYHSSFSIASVIGHLVDTDGVRTHDPLLAKQMFYQLNYWPIIKKFPVFQYADPVLDWIFCC